MEGLAAAFMFVLGGSGFIILDQTHATNMPKLNRTMLQFIGFGSLIIAFSCCWIFMKIYFFLMSQEAKPTRFLT